VACAGSRRLLSRFQESSVLKKSACPGEAVLEDKDIFPMETESLKDTGGLWGHPRGLTTLFFTEMWERFSFYGMRAILTLYMVTAPADGGLGFSIPFAATIYGIYQMMCYLPSFIGGLIADRIIGGRLSVLIGGIIIALGNFTLVIPGIVPFYAGLILIVTGTMFLKPNISTMLGSLYSKDDHRRDGGFSIFYMGINIGAALAPLAVGYLAQSASFKVWLTSVGIDPRSCWHWGFGVAGIGMILGLAQYVAHRERLKTVGNPPEKQAPQAKPSPGETTETEGTAAASAESKPAQSVWHMTKEEWSRVGALAVLFVFTILFWAIYEQAGTSLTLFAENLSRHEIFGMEFPSSWYQSLNPIFVMILAPIFSWMWVKMGDKEPSSPAKFAWGIFILALGIGIMVPAAILTSHGRVSPLWLLAVYFVECIGELCLSPVGLSTVTKLAPARLVGFFMGLWFFATALGDMSAGLLASLFTLSPDRMVQLFGGMAVSALVAALILALLTPGVRKLMAGIH
jgi:proton-dependent oligopeptide transporter, POT family